MKDSQQRPSVLITGASGGVGWSTVHELLDKGYYVYAHVRDIQGCTDKWESLPDEYKERVSFLACDFNCPESVKTWIEQDLQKVQVDVLINNAGIASKIKFEDVELEQWEAIWKVNVTSAFLLSQWAYQSMKQRQTGGLIVNIASMASIPVAEKFIGFVPYTTSKYALAGLSENIAAEGKPYGIRSICVSPGAVRTKMMEQVFPEAENWLEPREIAKFLVSLIHDFSEMCNGTNIIIKKE